MLRLLFLLLLLASAASAQTTHTVTVQNFSFSPSELTIQPGDTVTWTNQGGTHNVAQRTGSETFGNGAPSSAAWTYSFTFTAIGTSTYRCDAHPAQMRGSVVVESTTSVELPPAASARLVLAGLNPFSDAARLTLTLPAPQSIRAVVYDARGREVDVLWDGHAAGGDTALLWAAGNARAGTYIVRVRAEGIDLSRSVVRFARPE